MSRSVLAGDRVGKVVLAAPFLILMLIFSYGPLAVAGWQGFGPPAGGLPPAPLQDVLARQDVAAAMLRSVAFLVIKVVVNVTLGLLLALALWGESLLKRLARALLLLPTLISVVVLNILVIFLFDREVGLANLVLTTLGGSRENWLLEPGMAQVILTGFSIWRDQGLVMFIFLAGLATVPTQLLEAAAVDGAGPVRSFFSITLPLLIRSTGFATIFSLYMGSQFIAPILQITKGGPQGSTTLFSYLIFQEAFEYFDYRSASALSLIFIVAILALAGLASYLTRPKWSY